MCKRTVDFAGESEALYRQLIENAPIGILACDTRGNIVAVNKALLQILGSSSEEETMKINMFTFPLLVEAGISGDFIRCLETETVETSEHAYTTKWGKNTYLRFNLTPLYDS